MHVVSVDATQVAILCTAAFGASIIDAMVGGGGLISVPALFIVLPTAPAPALLATNKMSSIWGAVAAVTRYSKSGQIPWKEMRWPAMTGLVTAIGGAACVSFLDSRLLRPLILVLLILVLAVTLKKKDLGAQREETPRPLGVGLAIGAVLGFYEGFFGPGTGSFLLFLFASLYGYSFLKASAAGRLVNLASSAGALGYFLSHGMPLYKAAIPMAGATILGGSLGSHLAITRGNKWIRAAFVCVVLAVIAKFGYDLAIHA